MKFGVVLPSYGAKASRLEILDTALLTESLGYESLWATDHLALPEADSERFGTIFEALTLLAYLAASVPRVKLGISALVLPQRNPVEVGKQLASLDVLSGGRVIVAAGIGWSRGEYANLGHSFENRARRMDEALKVLRTLWRGQRVVSFSGKYYSFENMVIDPRPLQPGGPPLWAAGDSPAALKRGLLLADGWHPNAMLPEALAGLLAPHQAALRLRAFAIAMRQRLEWGAPYDPQSAYLTGSPEEMIRRLRALEGLGVGQVLLAPQPGSQRERETALKRFAAEVMPALAGGGGRL